MSSMDSIYVSSATNLAALTLLTEVYLSLSLEDCSTDKCVRYPCQHGGKCLPSDQGAVCLCPLGFVGDLCEIRMDLQVSGGRRNNL